MNSHQFNDAWEKLKRAPVKFEVLKLVLAGHTNAEIARSRGRTEGTIRKQISKIYEDFGIKSEFPGDQSQRDKLKALFLKHKPERITDCSSGVTNEVSNEQELLNQDNLPHRISSSVKRGGTFLASAASILNHIDLSSLRSSSTRAVEGDEDLMSLATRMLEQLGFDQKFKVTKGFHYIGYRFKNPKKVVYPYRLILSKKQEGLYISIPQHLLKPYLLTLKYWVVNLEEPVENIAGRFLVLPLKRDIFLDSLHPNYWDILEVEHKTIGSFYLNKFEKKIHEGKVEDYTYYQVYSSIALQEFNPNTLSDSDSYLVLREDELFSYTWQTCIRSSEVLQEFIDHLGKILIPDGNEPYLDLDDIPF